MDEEDIDKLMNSLKVMKMKKAGKYSSKFKKKDDSASCTRCLSQNMIREDAQLTAKNA